MGRRFYPMDKILTKDFNFFVSDAVAFNLKKEHLFLYFRVLDFDIG
jgi:hypothetical protein